MKGEEKKTLYNKKIKQGKPHKQIIKELNELDYSQIIFKDQRKEIHKLREVISKLEKVNEKLKNDNFNLGLKNKPIIIAEYHDKPFPKEQQINRVRMVLRALEEPMTIDEIRKLAYGLTLGCIRDCLMVLYFGNEVIMKGDKYCLKCQKKDAGYVDAN